MRYDLSCNSLLKLSLSTSRFLIWDFNSCICFCVDYLDRVLIQSICKLFINSSIFEFYYICNDFTFNFFWISLWPFSCFADVTVLLILRLPCITSVLAASSVAIGLLLRLMMSISVRKPMMLESASLVSALR